MSLRFRVEVPAGEPTDSDDIVVPVLAKTASEAIGDHIVGLYRQGLSTRSIAARLGVARGNAGGGCSWSAFIGYLPCECLWLLQYRAKHVLGGGDMLTVDPHAVDGD